MQGRALRVRVDECKDGTGRGAKGEAQRSPLRPSPLARPSPPFSPAAKGSNLRRKLTPDLGPKRLEALSCKAVGDPPVRKAIGDVCVGVGVQDGLLHRQLAGVGQEGKRLISLSDLVADREWDPLSQGREGTSERARARSKTINVSVDLSSAQPSSRASPPSPSHPTAPVLTLNAPCKGPCRATTSCAERERERGRKEGCMRCGAGRTKGERTSRAKGRLADSTD